MTTILFLLGLLIVALACLWLLIAHKPLVDKVWNAFRYPEPYRTEVEEAARGQWGDPYPPEAAEAPVYDREPQCRIVAGSDLDRHRRPIAAVNADFAALAAAPELASLRDLDLTAYYVLPEGN